MLTILPRYCVAICVLASVAQSTRAADLLPADRPIAEVIDHYTDEKLKAAGATPAPQADDATIVRRLMLDLTGRIPTAAEAQQYVASTDPQKRSQLVDSLIDSPWFVRHSATQYNLMLRGVDGNGPDQRAYLLAALGENRPWNRMVRELLGGLPGDAADPPGPEQFVLKRLNDQDLLTRDVSSMFFGINITCCQCHTHPYVDTLSQDYFFGMKAFFSRSYEFQGKLFEKRFAPSKVKFKNNDGEEREVGLMFLTGTVVETPDAAVPDLNQAIAEENKLIEELKKKFKDDKKFPPAADFSPRGQLVKLAELPEGQRLIARSIVNRLWFDLYGHGLVMPVDQMHAENSPSHPELLEWLSRDFIAHGWDLRRLTRGLVSSQAYSRSSRWTEKTPPRKDLFAVAELRPLTPMQFGMSVLMLGNSDFDSPQDADALTKRIEGLEGPAGGTFGSIIDRPQLGLQINVNEPLGMSNDPGRIRAITSRLVPQLMKLDDPRQQIDLAVWSVLGRPPTSQEVELLTRYLADHSTLSADERARIEQPTDADLARQAREHMVWALVAGPEFRFNH